MKKPKVLKPEEDKEIEEAIKFLIHAIHNSGRNPKPVARALPSTKQYAFRNL